MKGNPVRIRGVDYPSQAAAGQACINRFLNQNRG